LQEIVDGEVRAGLRARAEELAVSTYWHHSIRLFPDLVTKGCKTETMLADERAAILEPLIFDRRSVLDIGSWNGYFAFEAKRLGAGAVTASDSYTWRDPGFRGRATFDLARACLGLEIDAVEIDPTELPGGLAPHDIVLFLGVFYHLFDPIEVLGRVARLARDVLVVETHEALQQLDRPAMIFYPGRSLDNDPTNWWAPNPECLFELLSAEGFQRIFYQRHPAGPTRGIYHAFRNTETAAAYLRRQADNRSFFDLNTEEGRTRIFGQGAAPPPSSVRSALRQTVRAVAASLKWRLTHRR
jgi:tRNA (mo5U34)-methyltransferase